MTPILNRWYPVKDIYSYEIPYCSTIEVTYPDKITTETIYNNFRFCKEALIWRVLSFPKKMVKKEIKGWVREYRGDYSHFQQHYPQGLIKDNSWKAFPATLSYEVEE